MSDVLADTQAMLDDIANAIDEHHAFLRGVQAGVPPDIPAIYDPMRDIALNASRTLLRIVEAQAVLIGRLARHVASAERDISALSVRAQGGRLLRGR